MNDIGPLMNQPTAEPTRKVYAAGASGMGLGTSLAPIIFWVLELTLEVDVPGPVVAAGSGFLGGLFAMVGGYMAKERAW